MENNNNYLGMSCVSISQFHRIFGWEKNRKVWNVICDYNISSSIFMEQHSRDCIKFWSRYDQQSSLKHL